MTADADRIAREEREIQELERREANALQAGDIASLQTLWADDLVVNSTANLIAGKEILLDMVKSGRLKLDNYERRPIRITPCGDIVITTGNEVSQVVVQSAGYKLFVSYMNVWAKRASGWQLVARHVGLIERVAAEL
jgi:ketosteroid isomerase-like protein